MAGKLHYMPFFVSDWLNEPGLRVCSKEAKAFWIDFLCVLWGGEDRGVASTGGKAWSDLQIAASVCGDTNANLQCLSELFDLRICSRNEAGAVFCRRMVRDEEKRRAENNKKKRQRGSKDVPPDVPPHVPPISDSDSESALKLKAEYLYSIYPKRVNRARAIKAILSALKTVDYAVLLESVEEYANARIGQESKYTPHPASWFNGQRWLDDRSTWTDQPASGKSAPHSGTLAFAKKHGVVP